QRDEYARRGDRERVSGAGRTLRARRRFGRARNLSRRTRGAPAMAHPGRRVERQPAHGPVQVFLTGYLWGQARTGVEGGIEPGHPERARAALEGCGAAVEER